MSAMALDLGKINALIDATRHIVAVARLVKKQARPE
jgi:hypothetical protein